MPETTDNQLLPIPAVEKLKNYLIERHDAAVEALDGIVTVTDETYAEAEATLSDAKMLYDQMSAKRKAFTDPIRKAIEEIMLYENAINYTTDKSNKYNRARKVLEDYNQQKLEATRKAEYEAKLVADQLKYKARYKANVMQQLNDMLTGVHKNLLSGMAEWEKGLTLETIVVKEEGLKKSNPTLKQDHYNGCFRRWGQEPFVMNEKEEDNYLLELKKEFTYEMYNEKFQLIVAPLKNEYLAKIPDIRAKLEEIAKATQAKKEEMEKKRLADLEAARLQSFKVVEEQKALQDQAIKDEKDLGTMEADFTQQALTSDLEAGPTEKVASFTNDKLWLKPFAAVIGKVSLSPKFKGIMDSKGFPRKEVQWWLDQYGSLVGEPIEGITLTEVAKTAIRKQK